MSDFRGPVRDSFDIAITESSIFINFEFERTDTTLLARVYAGFNRYESWSVDEDTVVTLNHEQRHFDIAEIACRMIRKDVSETFSVSAGLNEQWRGVRTGVGFYYANYYKDEQALYDRETGHGTDPDKQAKWNKRIDSLLYAYRDYASEWIVLPISDTIW